MAEAATITNEPDGVLAFGIDGPSSSVADYGRITDGTLSLAGSADPVYENGFTPSPDTEYFVDTGASTGRSRRCCTAPRPTTPTPVRSA